MLYTVTARASISIATRLADWVGHAALHLCPPILAKLRLFADETTMPVLDPGRGHTKTGQSGASAADRPWGGAFRWDCLHLFPLSQGSAATRAPGGLQRNPAGRRLSRFSQACGVRRH